MSWTRINKNNYRNATPCHRDTNYALLERFISDNEIVSYKKDIGYGTTVLRFFQNGGRSCGNKHISMKELYGHPFIDHYMFFKNKDGEVLFASQPYTSKEFIVDQFNKMFSNDFELIVYDSKDSWYCPGSVTLFIIKLKKK